MTQRAITVLAPLSQERRHAVAQRIEAIGTPNINTRGLHYLSSSVIDDKAEPEQIRSYVLLELNVDGKPKAFLRRFVTENPNFLDQLFDDCDGYDRQQRYQFLIRKNWRHLTYHRGTPGRTEEQNRTGKVCWDR